jgi:hypothetical protein
LEGLLKADEGSLCGELLTGPDLVRRLDGIDRGQRREILDGMSKFANRFATLIFDREARARLTEGGWQVLDFVQGEGHRADFVAVRPGFSALVAARVAAPRKTAFGPRRRLADAEEFISGLKRVVVVPDHVDHLWTEMETGPMTLGKGVYVTHLGRLISEPGLLKADPASLPLAKD